MTALPLPAPDSCLTLQALVTLVHDLDISRLVRPETTDDGLPAVRLCGLLRLRGRRRAPGPALLAESLCPETGRWQRLSPAAERNVLSHIQLGFVVSPDSDGALMTSLRQRACAQLLKVLARRNITLTGHVSTVMELRDTTRLRGIHVEIPHPSVIWIITFTVRAPGRRCTAVAGTLSGCHCATVRISPCRVSAMLCP